MTAEGNFPSAVFLVAGFILVVVLILVLIVIVVLVVILLVVLVLILVVHYEFLQVLNWVSLW